MTKRSTIHFAVISLIGAITILSGIFLTTQKVEAQAGALSCSVTFDQNPITSGQSTTVHWTSTGSPDSFLINGIGAVSGSGSASVSPASTRNFNGTVTIDPKTTTTSPGGSAGAQSFTAPGTYSFTVPAYGTLTVQVWGGGAGGGGGGGVPAGAPGGTSSFSSVSASGGAGGQNALHPAGGGSAAGGAGGSGNAGTGGAGQSGALNAPGTGRGGAGASGGAGGAPAPCFSGRIAPGGNGGFPGGAGAGGCGNYATKVVQPTVAGGGGGGGFAQNTFTTGQLTPGSVITVVVGAGGIGGGQNGISGSELGGNGAGGQVSISWTGAAPVTTTIPGQTATCAATLTVNSCPAGQTWNGTACVSTCSAPRSLVGGVCSCPAGEIWNGTTCIPDPTLCAAPRSLIGGVCQCPVGQLFDGTSCVSSITCLPGNTLQTIGGVSQCVFTGCLPGFTLGTDSSGNPTCTAICLAQNVCGTGVDANNIVNSCTRAVVKICIANREQCVSGACVPLKATLDLKVTPSLVTQGSSVSVQWSATNVDSCDVLQDGTFLSKNASLIGTKQSGALFGRTVFTLSCLDYSGILKTDQEVVNIIPVFEENCAPNFHHGPTGTCVAN